MKDLTPFVVVCLLLTGCATTPPRDIDNACSIFREKGDWYRYSYQVFKEYGVPVHLQLAFIYQESRFMYDARPQREWLLGFIPWFRPSTSYGYAQVKDETWEWYRSKTQRYSDSRDDYEDAVNFIGWYVDLAHKQLGLSKWDVSNHYLAYHEGQGGFKQKTYRQKPWLLEVAAKVKRRAEKYRSQLKQCEDSLDRSMWWWPF